MLSDRPVLAGVLAVVAATSIAVAAVVVIDDSGSPGGEEEAAASEARTFAATDTDVLAPLSSWMQSVEQRLDALEAQPASTTSSTVAPSTTTATTSAPTTSSTTIPTTSSTSTSSTLPATTTSTTGPPASPSGQAMPTDNLAGWRYVMGEDFRTDVALGAWAPGSTYNATIGVYPNTYFDTSRNTSRPSAQWGQYDPGRVLSVSGGVLDKWLHTEGVRPKVAALSPFLTAHATATDWSDQLYGRYSVRYRVTNPMAGYKQAWLLWPESNDGRAQGEIDFPEVGFETLDKVGGFVHHINGTSGGDQYVMPTKATDLKQWHTATAEWSPNLVRFLWDGVEVGRHTDRIPNTAMHWVLQTETAVSSTAPVASTEGHVQIDWVAVWAYAP